MYNDSVNYNQFYPWITCKFFEKILRRDQNDQMIIVKKYTIKQALGKGENYSSQMLRASICYDSTDRSEQSISLIIKARLTTNLEMAKVFDDMGIFKKEIIAFQRIIPKVEALLESIGDTTKLAPKCYEGNIELSYLIFEDLSTSGYANIDCRIGLDVKHYKKLLTKLAKWHAATAVLIEKKSISFDDTENPLNSETMKTMILNTVTAMADAVTDIPGYEYLSPKFHALTKTIHQKILNATAINDDDFNTICHGDLWTNNIMFRHDMSGNVTDAILVDFQIIFWGSSILDVIYTLLTSSHQKVRDSDWTNLVAYYHAELVRILTALNYQKKMPTLTEIREEQLQRQVFVPPLVFMGMAIKNLDNVDDDDGDLKFIRQTSEYHELRVTALLNPNIRKDLEFFLSYFDGLGYFD